MDRRPGEAKMILHVGPADKFMGAFVELLRAHFPPALHEVRLLGRAWPTHPVRADPGVRFIGDSPSRRVLALGRLWRDMHRAERIILHGLFHEELFLPLLLSPEIARKCYWVMWGGDLHADDQRGFALWRFAQLRRLVVPKMAGLVTYLPEDVAHAQQAFGARIPWKECLCYPSNLVPDVDTGLIEGGNAVLVGNSADPTNCHAEIFRRIAEQGLGERDVICPLSYGGQRSAAEVVTLGRRLFGARFRPLLEMLPLPEYRRVLASVGIAIFGHRRQQGMGNIISLLAMGKTVMLRSEIGSFQFLTGLGVSLRSMSEFSLQSLSSQATTANRKIVLGYFTRDRLIQQWRAIFEEALA